MIPRRYPVVEEGWGRGSRGDPPSLPCGLGGDGGGGRRSLLSLPWDKPGGGGGGGGGGEGIPWRRLRSVGSRCY